jgi:1-acyl-sn-glycerol-3-phosphate acyltransferase
MIAQALIGITRAIVGGHARWQGRPSGARQRIYFANHSSHLDTLVLWAALPRELRATTRPVAAQDYWGKSRLRRYVATKVLNAVLVDRASHHDPLASLRAALDRGESLILFPEGTRGDRAAPARFKPGLHQLARDYPALELVPVYLANLARAYPKGAILPVPISCVASFGAPLARCPGEPKGIFLERARAAVCALGDAP